MHNYDDIINLPHHVSRKYQHMSIINRAGQFAPFAALTGFSDEIKEVARITDDKIILNDYDELDRKLQYIINHIDNDLDIILTYFVADKKKKGGKYLTVSKRIKRIDTVYQKIFFTDKSYVYVDDIIKIDIVNIP